MPLTSSTVHPRVCGEQSICAKSRLHLPGSSPRVRGTVSRSRRQSFQPRFIPACAGNSFSSMNSRAFGSVHPRVCGEQISNGINDILDSGSSPRVRGTGDTRYPKTRQGRFIPACAGNRVRGFGCTSFGAVHPRVCGEQVRWIDCHFSGDGSSPRVRGTEDHIAVGSRLAPVPPHRSPHAR